MENQSNEFVANEVVARPALEKSKVIAEVRKPMSRLYERVGASFGVLFVYFLVQPPFHGLTQILIMIPIFGAFVFCVTQAIRKLNDRVEALSTLLLERQDH
jgi:hypothetical protein